METFELQRVNLHNFLVGQEGKFVSLQFTKLNGETRDLNGRLGVTQHCGTGESTCEREDLPYLTVYDVKAPGYRAVNLATVSRVKAQGREMTVIG